MTATMIAACPMIRTQTWAKYGFILVLQYVPAA